MKPSHVLLSFLVTCIGLSFSQSELSASKTDEKLRFGVAVANGLGVPIRDLQSDEFVIEVGGKIQPASTASAAASSATEGDASSNRGIKGRGLVVVVLDTIHANWNDEKDLRASAGRYLAWFAQRDAPISLLVLSQDRKLHAVHEYTAGSATLAAALERADAEMHHRTSAGNASPEVAAETRRLVDFYRGTSKDFAWAQQIPLLTYPGAVLDGFHTVAEYTANIPGRKSLIWVSGMIPFEMEEKQGRIASLSPDYTHRMTEHELSQLQELWKTSMAAIQRSQIALFPVATRTNAITQVSSEVLHAMVSLARMSGGREVHTVGDAFQQLEDLPESNSAAYDVLVPLQAVQDCKAEWCELRITVKRAGARVLAPNGFFRDMNALQPAATQAKALHPTLDSNSASGPDSIPFTVSWKPAEPGGNKKKLPFNITFGPEAGLLKNGSNELDLEITVHAICNGVDKQAVKFDAKGQLPPTTLDQVHLKGFVLNNVVSLETGEYDVRFVVHDKTSGRSGIVHSPLKVNAEGS